MNKAIVIGSTTKSVWLENCLRSFNGYKDYPILVVVNDDFECGKLRWVVENTDIEEIFLLHDTVEIKDPVFFNDAFEKYEGVGVALTDEPTIYGMFLGKYRREILSKIEIPITKTKIEAVDAEMDFNKLYAENESRVVVYCPDLRNTEVFEEKFGRKNMVLENKYIKKYKATWSRDQL
jgi:hypothetical protein